MMERWIIVGLASAIVGFGASTPNQPVATPEPATVSAPAAVPVKEEVKLSTTDARVASALEALAGTATRLSNEDALKSAFRAYFNFKAAHPEDVKKPYLYFVDYGLNNRTPRGYVFDMEQLKLIDGPFIVAHGRGSSSGKDGVPMRFSNAPRSAATSLGLYVTGESYGFTGHSGGGTYSSIGLR